MGEHTCDSEHLISLSLGPMDARLSGFRPGIHWHEEEPRLRPVIPGTIVLAIFGWAQEKSWLITTGKSDIDRDIFNDWFQDTFLAAVAERRERWN
jgi:hypothetical protein